MREKIAVIITIIAILTPSLIRASDSDNNIVPDDSAALEYQLPADDLVLEDPSGANIDTSDPNMSSGDQDVQSESEPPSDLFELTPDAALATPEVYASEFSSPSIDVPVIVNEKVEAYIHYFTNRLRDKFSSWLALSGRYLPMMRNAFKEKGLPEDLTYIALIESGFNNKAYSRAKAVGQWQFIQGTGKRYGLRIDRWIDERRDPVKATDAAADYLGDLYTMFNDWYIAAAGYNAGEGKMSRAIAKYDTADFWQLSQPKYKYLKPETKDYVPKFLAAMLIAKEPQKYGFSDIEYHSELVFEKVTVSRMIDLRELSASAGVSLDELKALNPELKTHYTPPSFPDYQLNVPVDKKADIENAIPSLRSVSEKAALKEVGPEKKSRAKKYKKNDGRVKYYVVKNGDTLDRIASIHKVNSKDVARWNKIKGSQIKAGKKLKIYVKNEANSGKLS